eukprot:2888249-Pleurochrysis_carterae.AAC.17
MLIPLVESPDLHGAVLDVSTDSLFGRPYRASPTGLTVRITMIDLILLENNDNKYFRDFHWAETACTLANSPTAETKC